MEDRASSPFSMQRSTQKTFGCRDKIIITYAVMSQYSPNTSDTVTLKACYSPFSRVNRPWRNLNNVIAVQTFSIGNICKFCHYSAIVHNLR